MRNPFRYFNSSPEVQLRAKLAGDREALRWSREIRRLTREHGVLFLVNDRFDLALLAEADAVHLGQGDLPPNAMPGAARERLAVGRSTHTRAQLEATQAEDVDYVAFGPVFGTTSKHSEYSARGLEAVTLASALAAPRPLIAIGGIGRDQFAALRVAGAAGVAVISVVAGATNPTTSTRELVAAFEDNP